MPRSVTFNGVTHTFPDDATDEEIAGALDSESQQPTPTEKHASLTDKAASALPMVGGAVGGFVGGIPGAAAGGAAGEGFGALVKHAGEIPGAVADVARNAFAQPAATLQGFMQGAGQGAKDAGISAATQGAMDAGGQVLGGGLKLLGKGIYKGGVGMLPKGLKVEFPNLAQAGFDEGVALTGRGAEKAKGLVKEGSQVVRDKLATAEAAGAAPVTARELAPSLRPVRDTFAARAELGAGDETPRLAGRLKSIKAKSPSGIKLTRAQDLKSEAQDLANSAYRAQERSGIVNSGDLMTNEALAKGLRQAIESRVPSVGADNQRLQSLIGLERAGEHASNTANVFPRAAGASVLGGLGLAGGPIGGIVGTGAGLLATTPQGLTLTGLGLKGLGQAAQSPIAPDLLRAALLAQLASQ